MVYSLNEVRRSTAFGRNEESIRRTESEHSRNVFGNRTGLFAWSGIACGIAVCFLAWHSLFMPVQAGESPRTYTVKAGDTVWSIATHFRGVEGDPRPVVEQIIEANKLNGNVPVVRPGQVLVIPNP